MMTHGWRRYTWKDILDDQPKDAQFAPESSIEVKGVAQKQNGKPYKELDLVVLFNETAGFESTKTDEFGNFKLKDLNFADTLTAIFQVGKRVEPDIVLEVSTDVSHPVTPLPQVTLKDSIPANYFKNFKKVLQVKEAFKFQDSTLLLDEITIEAKKEEDVDRRGMVLHGKGVADRVYDEDFLKRVFTMRQFLLQLPGAKPVYRNGVQAGISLSRGAGSGPPALFILDGFEVPYDQVLTVVPSSIKQVEILRTNILRYGQRGLGGVVAIFSKEGGPQIETIQKTSVKKIMGFYQHREFYVPNYEEMTEDQAIRPDYRSTIFWQPWIFTDEEGKSNISFFAADNPGIYEVIIEGLGFNGKAGRQVLEIRVDKE